MSIRPEDFIKGMSVYDDPELRAVLDTAKNQWVYALAIAEGALETQNAAVDRAENELAARIKDAVDEGLVELPPLTAYRIPLPVSTGGPPFRVLLMVFLRTTSTDVRQDAANALNSQFLPIPIGASAL